MLALLTNALRKFKTFLRYRFSVIYFENNFSNRKTWNNLFYMYSEYGFLYWQNLN